ncbi:MAG TPA: glycosyltransferase family 4 protein [Actinomycetota bacterium]|nr:glycosyltransferase family 4 protein [Actinomycetota bacterium]
MQASRLIYLSNVRFPSPRAHGHAIVRMCAALAECGLGVELWHPGDATPESIFDFYGLPRTFEIREVANLGLHGAAKVLPGPLATGLAYTRGLMRSRIAVRAATRAGADVYWSRDPNNIYWLTRYDAPCVFEAHAETKKGRAALVTRAARRDCFLHAITVTSHLREQLVEIGVPPEKVSVVPNAVDVDAYRDLPDRDGCRARLGLPTDRSIVGYVGRFTTTEGEKGLTTLVAAAGRLRAQNGARPLLVAVGGPVTAIPNYLQHARNLGVDHENLRFFDHVPAPEVPLWVRACDVVTVPSPDTHYTARVSSPLKVFEYLAAGAAIVASDLPAIRETLTDGEDALLVPPEDPDALADAISRLLDSPEDAERLRRNALALSADYSWRSRAERGLDAAGIRVQRSPSS